ncbi:hypothetical protein BDP27DRAFT_1448939 [Rhodocollybia butyracea]|uniref:DUF1793-domain-containing protein n=1 Tax=Rhodocollybia butyracea TaxID=206335 RepID=A0A9P5PPJ8_9AGAR|nr:hypothetical protein BDP27DRAFT_1448939 [Rhodocollybia butyracea]
MTLNLRYFEENSSHDEIDISCMQTAMNSLWNVKLSLCLMFFLFSPIVFAWTATPFNPPSYPLAVRTPYLSAWLPSGGSGKALNDVWPQFWTGATVGWAGFANVDEVAYNFLGNPVVSGTNFTKATQISAEFTSTQSIFVFTAGPVELTVTFLSPIEAIDLVKQSLPFSYLSVAAASTDGLPHTVAVYTDISGEWLTSNDTSVIEWNSTTTGSVLTHQSQLKSQTEYVESADRIQQGSIYYSTENFEGATYQTGQDVVVRAQFIDNGVLANTLDTNFRTVSDDWPVFAFAASLGMVTSEPQSAVFSVGHVRDPVVHYIQSGDALEDRSYYFWSNYSTVAAAISDFLSDYPMALARAETLDQSLQIAAASISSAYADIVALSMRQTFGATELTISGSPGAWNTSDVLMFLKEISSDGNVNTVDVIMPAWPAFMLMNPELGKYLILPLLQYQETGQYPNVYAAHDLGSTYPIANGHNLGNDEPMPIEESGNMINMALDYTQRTGDTSLVTTYSGLFTQWADYLVANTLFPADQLSTTDFAGPLPNQTNLAIKGIIGIQAMSVISETYLNDTVASNSYRSTAASYLSTWQEHGISSDGSHLILEYGNDSTDVLGYNLAMDKLLGLNFIPPSVNSLQSAWYANNIEKYGFPIDSRTTYTSADWMIWTAMTTSAAVQTSFIDAIHSWLSSGLTSTPFGDRFEDDTGINSSNENRPVVGGNLALLLSNKTV